jgi:hypothetical protein
MIGEDKILILLFINIPVKNNLNKENMLNFGLEVIQMDNQQQKMVKL